MGYTTEFEGKIDIVPPLNQQELAYVNKFCEVRHMERKKGPYYVGNKGFAGQDREPDITNYNRPDPSQPGLWCNYEVSEDGSQIYWNGSEKSYDMAEWLAYLIDHFLGTKPIANVFGAQFQGHTLNGALMAQGEESDDVWRLIVINNVVYTADAKGNTLNQVSKEQTALPPKEAEKLEFFA